MAVSDRRGKPQWIPSDVLRGNRIAAHARCWRDTQVWSESRGLDWCSIHSCKRQLDKRIPPEKQAKHRDPKMWRSKFATYHEQHPERHAAGECWVADHRPLDLIVMYEGRRTRPVITLWHDWRTRKVVGWWLSCSPNTQTILAALRMAINDASNNGPPALVWMDNGKDFDSYALKGQSKKDRMKREPIDETWFGGVLGSLGIEPHFSLAHNPQGKARCERWFATMATQFDKGWATYTGNTTVSKPESLTFRLNKQAHTIPDFAIVLNHLRDYIAQYNANDDHQMHDLCDRETQQKLSPAEAYAAWSAQRVLADPSALDLCMMPHTRPVTVGRNGVRVKLPGLPARNYGQYEDRLMAYKGTGKKVYVAYDYEDTRQVQVRDAATLALICVASVNGNTGVYGAPESHAALKAADRQRREFEASLRVVAKHREEMVHLTEDQRIAVAAKKLTRRAKPHTVTPDPDRPMKLVRTPFDDQSEAIKKQTRKAVGDGTAEPNQPSKFKYKPASQTSDAGSNVSSGFIYARRESHGESHD